MLSKRSSNLYTKFGKSNKNRKLKKRYHKELKITPFKKAKILTDLRSEKF